MHQHLQLSSHTEWFRVTGRTKPTCIASIYGSKSLPSPCVGFQNGFKMSSDKYSVYLEIKQVDLSHSGLYFCGFYLDTHTIFAYETLLIVQDISQSGGAADSNIEKGPDGMTNLTSVILAAVNEKQGAERNKDLHSDEPNYAALRFQVKPKRDRRPACERELDSNVVYVATR
ncbi:uncharacterized protein AB9W97_010099 isoform 2-T2 [Spinachia spinachia]